MMRLKHTFILSLLLVTTGFIGHAQETDNDFRHHRISLIMSNAHVPKALGREGSVKWLVLGGWGLDYDYHFNRRWAVSFQSDIVLSDFVVREFDSGSRDFLKRAYPVTLVVAGLYSFDKHVSLIAGGGLELAPEENLLVLRLGLDYEWELTEVWGICLNLVYDLKLEVYDTWSFGVGVNRRF